MIEIEQSALRALEQNAPPAINRAIQINRGICQVRNQPTRSFQVLLDHPLTIGHERAREQRGSEPVFLSQDLAALLPKHLRIAQVGRAQAPSMGFVLVRRTNALGRGADPAKTSGFLGRNLMAAMVRQDQMGAVADQQAFADLHSAIGERFQFLGHGHWIHYHAVAQNSSFARTQNTGRNQLQHKLPATDNDSMPRVCASLIARHDVEMLGENIDYFPLTLIAPLYAHYHYIV